VEAFFVSVSWFSLFPTCYLLGDYDGELLHDTFIFYCNVVMTLYIGVFL